MTGTRPRGLTDELAGGSDFRIVFPADAWHAEEQGAVHRRRWWSDRRAIISIENLDTRARVVSIACGLASPHLDRVDLRLNGSTVWSGEVVGAPIPVFTMAATLHPGANTLEVLAENPPRRTPGDPRTLGIAVYDIALSTERPHREVRSIKAGGMIGRARTLAPPGDPGRDLGYAEPARLEDVSDLTALLREPDAHRARLRGEVERLTALLQESDADRAARLDQIHKLSRLLQEADADRVARLDQVHELSRLLQQSEADRAARLEVIQNLQAELASLQARVEEIYQTQTRGDVHGSALDLSAR